MRRLFIIVSAVLLLVSLVGVFAARTLPTEVEEQTTVLSYEHEGRFDYLVYLKPSYLFGPEPEEPPPPPPLPPNPKYPAEIVDSIDFTFRYSPEERGSQEAWIDAVLENPSIWQKRIKLVPYTSIDGDCAIRFSLDTEEIHELFDDIEEEIKITSSTRNLTINAYVTAPKERFIQSLPIKLTKTLIEVDSNLRHSQPCGVGKFDYVVNLKENSIFNTKTLEPPPSVPPPTPPPPALAKTVGPGEVIFSKLVDKIDATFHYKFKSDKPIRELSQEVTITAVLENPEVWSKKFVLVPRTKKRDDFSIDFPLDISQFTEMLEAIRSETGVPAESYNLTITADVHTIAQTDFGAIDEVFSQTLSSALGKGTLEWNEELTKSEPSSITTSQMIPNPSKYVGLSVSEVRNLSTAAAGIFFLFLLFSVVLYIKFKPAELSQIEKEAQRVSKKYGSRMAEATSQTPLEGEKIISLGSMEDLIKVADELGKPIIHQAPTTPEEAHAYYVFDGATRYEYLFTAGTKEQASNAEKTE